MTQSLPRRDFLMRAAAGTAAAGVAAVSGAAPAPALANDTPAAPPPAPAPASTQAAAPEPMQILTATEAAFLTAVSDTMIPADALSPSGSDCGVVTFIDRQLAGSFGAGARMYRSGPFRPAAQGQGYQLPLTPLDYFRAGIAAANLWSRKNYGKELDGLAPADCQAALKAMESGKADLGELSSKAFFAALLQIVMEGFFSDPIYGGNRDKASWKMIGYPGLPATYADKIESYRGRRYDAEPQSIADFS
jgi:gluconate 2-dehydrogenase gamma chain